MPEAEPTSWSPTRARMMSNSGTKTIPIPTPATSSGAVNMSPSRPPVSRPTAMAGV